MDGIGRVCQPRTVDVGHSLGLDLDNPRYDDVDLCLFGKRDPGGQLDAAVLHDAILETGLTEQPAPPAIESILWLYEFERLRQHNDPEDGGDSETDAVDELLTAYWR